MTDLVSLKETLRAQLRVSTSTGGGVYAEALAAIESLERERDKAQQDRRNLLDTDLQAKANVQLTRELQAAREYAEQLRAALSDLVDRAHTEVDDDQYTPCLLASMERARAALSNSARTSRLIASPEKG